MVNRLLPSYAPPPKEGRSHAYSPKIQKWQRSTQFRIVVFLVGIAATYLIFSPYFTSSGDLTATKLVAAKDGIKKPFLPKVSSEDEHRAPSWPQDEPVAKHEPEREIAQKPAKQISGAEPVHHEEPKPKAPERKPAVSIPKTDGGRPSKPEDQGEFQRKLQKVISLLPGEVNTRELLREPEGTGKERLREVGLRTRSFSTFFEAWEELHLVYDGDVTRVRDDIVQYMRTFLNGQVLAESIHSYEQFRYFFQRFSNLLFPWTAPYWADHVTLHSHFRNGGRGIVLSAGDDQASYLLTSIQTFRKLGCTLPIEVMYLGDRDLDEDYRLQLEDLPGVVTRDMSQMISDDGWRVLGWAGKPFAILMSSFREVIFIDADSLFFDDPAVMFDDPGYVETGALFFRDRKIMPESKKRWLQQLLPKPISKNAKQSYMWTGDSGHYQESGVVVVDKWKHFVSMLLVTRMNGPDRDSNKDEGIIGVYDMVYGDKETYWLAWELSGDLGYSFHQGAAGIMGKIEENRIPELRRLSKAEKMRLKAAHPELDDVQIDAAMEQPAEAEGPPTNFTICAPQLLHLHLDGTPLWFNGWIMAKKEGDKKKERFSGFERYSAEPKQKVGEDDAWKLHEDNICCLTTDETYEFTEQHRDVLEMIIEVAKDVKSKGELSPLLASTFASAACLADMTLNAEELRKAATPLYEADLKAIPEQFSELLERYSMVPKEEQINHVLTLRNRAYELKAYPCLGRFRFLELDLSNHPLYPDVLRKLRAEDQDELFLDFGCCIGQDVRKLIFDGAPVSKVYGSDLLPDFVKTGYELFRDENTLSRDHWIAPADAFDESEGNALAQLEGKITILHVSAVFHLFGLEQQRQLARRCLRLLSRNTNCLVMGGQTANVEAGEYPRAAGTLRWRHNSQSWADLWEETAKNNGRCKVEAHSALAERLLGKGTKDDLGDRQSDEDERKKVIGRHEEGFRWMTWWTWVQFEG